MLLDISRAHLHSPLARAVFVTTDGKVYKLLKAMYGLRDAGAAFDRKVLDVMNLMGLSLGKFSICVGYQKVMDTYLTCRDECLFEANTSCLVQWSGQREASDGSSRPTLDTWKSWCHRWDWATKAKL